MNSSVKVVMKRHWKRSLVNCNWSFVAGYNYAGGKGSQTLSLFRRFTGLQILSYLAWIANPH